MGQFKKLSPSRMAEIKAALNESRKKGKGLAFNSESGHLQGVASVSASPDDKRNVIAKNNVHYSIIGKS